LTAREKSGACPICGLRKVWIEGRILCCGAEWAHCPDGDPFLLEVEDVGEFQAAITKHEKQGKALHLMPDQVD